MTEPLRCQHYQFAHAALRSVAFANPVQLMTLLATPDVQSAFVTLLEQVEQDCKDGGEPCDFDASQIGVHQRRAAGHPCAVVEMPPPRATSEAYYAAPVLLMDVDPEKVALRYFTLEYAAEQGDGTGTVLGEWAADGRHVNHGVGPAPSLEPFLAAVSALLVTPR
jgi:hypothetical protein